MLPAIFRGPLDALPCYQLATLCRLNYRNLEDGWTMVSRGLRRHLVRQTFNVSGGDSAPKVTVLTLNDHNVVIINGSTNLADWIQHTRSPLMHLFAGTPEAVGIQYYDAATAIMATLNAAGFDFTVPVVLAGHSYGGAIANVMARLWKIRVPTNTPRRAVLSFGCPRIGNPAFWDAADWQHWRCMHGVDFVTQIPVTGWVFEDTVVSLAPRFSNYVHGGRVYYAAPGGPIAYNLVTRFSANEVYVNGVFDSGMINFERQNFTILEAVGHHAMWNYTLAWRRAVKDAERYSLAAFDAVNDIINTDTGDSWPDVTIKVDGFSTDKRRLPDDPPDGPELLDFPQPSAPATSTVPIPPVEWQMQEQARRHRRTI